jgi:hypothetical protein
MQSSDPFYRLDNSAILTAAVANAEGPFVFRVSCTLFDTVQIDVLSLSMARLAPRFPFFHVSMGNGVFWQYLNPLSKVPLPEAEGPYPAAPLPARRGKPLFRVIAYGRRIACEFHHAITDGTGAIAYLRALVCDYCIQKGINVDADELSRLGIPHSGETPDPEECQDAYGRFFSSSVPPPDPRPQAFLLPGWRRYEGYRETVGTASLEDVISVSRGVGVSLTEFVASVYLATLQDTYEALSPGPRRRANKFLAVQIPVNLRKLYPSRTLRNFTLLVGPTLDMRLGHWDFSEIVTRVHHELRMGLSTKEFARQLRLHVGGERNIFGRSLFLPLKALMLRRINATMGVSTFSGSVSNLGAITLPPAVDEYVESFGFLPSRASVTGANVGIISWKDMLLITVGSLATDRQFERLLYSRLAALGIAVKVECNEAYEGVPI